MEDETRPLPTGWVRSYDAETHHQFFVDTTKEPPRSVWHHPYDDSQYMASISPEERARIEALNTVHHDESSDDDSHEHAQNHKQGAGHAELPPRQGEGEHKTLGPKMKDKLTNSTHEERVQQRKQREQEEAQAYAQHRAIRLAMSKALQTGQPQFLAKDKEGRDVYIEPPHFGGHEGFGGPAYGGRAVGYSPYRDGMYTTPNARYLRPDYGYDRPYPYVGGYGGGLGLPILGGLGGGLLLGGLLF
jgi:hypothetical protein